MFDWGKLSGTTPECAWYAGRVLKDAAAGTPGWEAVRMVEAVDPSVLSHAARIDGLVTLERQIGFLQGLQQTYLAALAAGPTVAPSVGDIADNLVVADKGWVREAVACALKVSTP